MGDQTASYWRWLGNLEIAPDWFQSATRSVASGFDLLESVVDEDLRRHIQRYEGLLMEGNRVLVVAHSQGNLYANAPHTRLADKGLPIDAFGIVSVANPASHIIVSAVLSEADDLPWPEKQMGRGRSASP